MYRGLLRQACAELPIVPCFFLFKGHYGQVVLCLVTGFRALTKLYALFVKITIFNLKRTFCKKFLL